MRWLIRMFMARFAARFVREIITRFSQSAAHGRARSTYR
ncbi:MAG: hypothetical protein JWM93_2910 [Frankiales bacterium]|nr:hypothetical protein [Frankiales bacterium]